MAIVRWDPFADVRAFQDEINRWFSNSPLFRAREGGVEASDSAAILPAVDIHEEDDAYVLSAELPGVKKEDIDVHVEGNRLTIRAEKKAQSEKSQKNVHRVERTYGVYVRSFSLPDAVEATKLKASYKDGVLHVTVPKAAQARPTSIKVE